MRKGKNTDYQAEIDALKRRIEALEARPYVVNPPYTPPIHSAPMGCVCPIGAEFGCHSAGCPRRGISGVMFSY